LTITLPIFKGCFSPEHPYAVVSLKQEEETERENALKSLATSLWQCTGLIQYMQRNWWNTLCSWRWKDLQGEIQCS